MLTQNRIANSIEALFSEILCLGKSVYCACIFTHDMSVDKEFTMNHDRFH